MKLPADFRPADALAVVLLIAAGPLLWMETERAFETGHGWRLAAALGAMAAVVAWIVGRRVTRRR